LLEELITGADSINFVERSSDRIFKAVTIYLNLNIFANLKDQQDYKMLHSKGNFLYLVLIIVSYLEEETFLEYN
jgi:hypothetical protein